MTELCIADPPYLGRSDRWYGKGRGSGRGLHKADNHPEAYKWDDPDMHEDMVAKLVAGYEGFAIAAAADTLPLYQAWCPDDVRVMIWHRRNAPPSGSRLQNSWEPVLVRIPEDRRGRVKGLSVRDVLDAPADRVGFAGAKPPEWTRWVLAALGYDPQTDTVTDLFNGSGSVAYALEGMLL